MSTDTPDERLVAANRLIQFISECGHRHFWEPRSGRVAALELDSRGLVYFVDACTEVRIYTHHLFEWKGFSHGGTLRTLIERLRDFIRDGGQIYERTLGPWPKCRRGPDPWGYGHDMEQVRAEARTLGVMK